MIKVVGNSGLENIPFLQAYLLKNCGIAVNLQELVEFWRLYSRKERWTEFEEIRGDFYESFAVWLETHYEMRTIYCEDVEEN